MENTRVPFALPEHHVFGGFWIRFAAYCVDTALMTLPVAIVSGLALMVGNATGNGGVVGLLLFGWVLLVVVWLFAYFIVGYGVWSTTPGKALFGMRVVREDNGGKVTWGQAFGRTFAYLLSRIMYIGYIIAAFDDEKRALHDHLAKTRVLRDTRKSTTPGWVVFGILWVLGLLVCVVVTFMIPTTWVTTTNGSPNIPYGNDGMLTY